jgi:cytochrome c biogenesis factor
MYSLLLLSVSILYPIIKKKLNLRELEAGAMFWPNLNFAPVSGICLYYDVRNYSYVMTHESALLFNALFELQWDRC